MLDVAQTMEERFDYHFGLWASSEYSILEKMLVDLRLIPTNWVPPGCYGMPTLYPSIPPHHSIIKEAFKTEQVDHRVVQQLHHAFRLLQISPCFGGAWLQFSNCLCRLGGHGAAAMALWWLEEGSTTGFHFDQAALDFQVASLASLLLHLFTWSCRSFPLR